MNTQTDDHTKADDRRVEKRVDDTGAPREEKRAGDIENRPQQSKTVSVRLSSIIALCVIALLLIVSGVLSWFLWTTHNDLADIKAVQADDRHAEQIATDYAVGASSINYQDFNAWLAKLKSNTTPQLSNKFDATAPQLQEILVPLQWTSTGTPITATVTTESDGIYQVNVFLNVTSTNAQTPNGGQTTVTYNVAVDKNADWKITDVGGLDAALPSK